MNSCAELGNVLDTLVDVKMNQSRTQAEQVPHSTSGVWSCEGRKCHLDEDLQLCQADAVVFQSGDDISYHQCHCCSLFLLLFSAEIWQLPNTAHHSGNESLTLASE